MYKNIYGSGFKNFIKYIGMFFVFFSIAMGFSLHNSIAVLEGHLGKKSEFVRTPKFNISKYKDNWKNNKYMKKTVSVHVVFEGLLMLYFAFGMYSAFIVGDQGGDFGLFPFHLMLFVGFGYVFFKSLASKVWFLNSKLSKKQAEKWHLTFPCSKIGFNKLNLTTRIK